MKIKCAPTILQTLIQLNLNSSFHSGTKNPKTVFTKKNKLEEVIIIFFTFCFSFFQNMMIWKSELALTSSLEGGDIHLLKGIFT